MGIIHLKAFTAEEVRKELENVLVAENVSFENRTQRKINILLEELAERNKVINETSKIIKDIREKKGE